jgi:two-component system LytT family sensor kinase
MSRSGALTSRASGMTNGSRLNGPTPSLASDGSLLFSGRVWAGAFVAGLGLSIVGAVFAYSGAVVASQPASWRTALTIAAPYWLIAVLFVPPSLALARRVRIDDGHAVRSVLIHLLGAISFASLHSAGVIVFHALRRGSFSNMQQLASVFLINLFALDCFVYCSVVGGYYVVLFYKRSAAAAADLRASRFDALRIQLAPHVLFNTLNLISMFSLRGDQKAVREMVARLSDLLRVVLDDVRAQEVPLARELEVLNSYLDIQRMVFGSRLTIERDVAPEAMDALVPRLVLQPLVENAIVHGIAAQAGEGKLAIHAVREQDTLNLRVVNSGSLSALDVVDRRREGIGFSNVRERLSYLYGENHTLRFVSADDGATTVHVSIPFHQAPAASGSRS